MYETHYGLARRPFGETVDPSAYVALPSHEAVLRRLRYALEHSPGPGGALRPAGLGQDDAGPPAVGQLAGRRCT